MLLQKQSWITSALCELWTCCCFSFVAATTVASLRNGEHRHVIYFCVKRERGFHAAGTAFCINLIVAAVPGA